MLWSSAALCKSARRGFDSLSLHKSTASVYSALSKINQNPMNKLSTAEQARIIACLVEGCSMRSIVRMTGFAKKTVARFQAEIGEACAAYHDRVMRDLPCTLLEVDEVWSFTYCKQKNIPERLKGDAGIGDT